MAASRKCNVGLCPNDRKPGSAQCAKHSRASAPARGYGGKRWESTKRTVKRRDPFCTCAAKDCHLENPDGSGSCMQLSTVVDHHPRERWELEAAGIKDPDKPEYCRGVCAHCHAKKPTRSDALR